MTRLLLATLLVGMCGCPAPGEEGPGGLGAQAWAVGSYFSPEYNSPDGHTPAQGLSFLEDRTWVHSSDGVVDDQGTWVSPSIGVIELDNGERLETPDNCRSFGYRGASYYRDDPVDACFTPSLSGLEYCLVGEFQWTTDYGTTSKLTVTEYTEDRLYVSSDYFESVSDYTTYTHVGYWTVTDGVLDPQVQDWTYELDDAFWESLEGARQGARHPQCDLPGPDPDPDPDPEQCDATCESGSICAAYDGYEDCCPSQWPSSCPDLHWCFSDAGDRDAACNTSYYGDPAYECEPGTIWLVLDDHGYCAPECSGSGYCPDAVDGTPGVCLGALDDGTEVCGLTCTNIGALGGECPWDMRCVANGGGGLCLF